MFTIYKILHQPQRQDYNVLLRSIASLRGYNARIVVAQ